HYQQGEFDEAEVSYARLARDFPRGRFDRLARLRSADSALANFPGVRFDDSSLLEAEARYQSYAAEYPEAAERQGVPERMMRIQESRAKKEYNIGQYYERTDSPRAAIYYYRYVAKTWPDTSWAVQSRHRLEVLGASQPSTPIEAEPAPQIGDSETP
ncbi:MAG: outer membrane protein assembly factor BamD, partial [Phycisphaerae bacterium]